MLLTKRLFKALLLTALITPLLAINARADTVTFDLLHTPPDPLGSPILIGDILNVNIVGLEFVELAGGTIDLGYDDGVVEIQDVIIDPYWDFDPNPGQKSAPGVWTGIAFDAFVNDPASGDFVIATLVLEAVGDGVSSLEILPSSQFFSATALLDPTIVNGTVTVGMVPLPAALWLMASALGGLVTVGFRRRASV